MWRSTIYMQSILSLYKSHLIDKNEKWRLFYQTNAFGNLIFTTSNKYMYVYNF